MHTSNWYPTTFVSDNILCDWCFGEFLATRVAKAQRVQELRNNPMVLQTQNPASHNQMLGQRILHPPSTNFDDEFHTPTAKRLKRLDSADSSLSRRLSDDEDDRASSPKRPPSREVPDSEAETDEEDEHTPNTSHKTELESALPPVKTDKEAIAEYEATRAAEAPGNLDLHERLGQRKWVQGKSSIYVDAFNLALETVLDDESHLFDEAEMAVFEHWRNLSYEGQYLWVLTHAIVTLDIIRLERLNSLSDMSACSCVKPRLGIERTAWDIMVILQTFQQRFKIFSSPIHCQK